MATLCSLSAISISSHLRGIIAFTMGTLTKNNTSKLSIGLTVWVFVSSVMHSFLEAEGKINIWQFIFVIFVVSEFPGKIRDNIKNFFTEITNRLRHNLSVCINCSLSGSLSSSEGVREFLNECIHGSNRLVKSLGQS